MEFFLYHVTFAGIAVLLTQSLNAIWRANMFSLGHHGYYAVGAYTSVIVARVVIGDEGWPIQSTSDRLLGAAVFLLCLFISGVVTGGIGFLSAWWFRKLRDDYFAVATLILAEIIRSLASNCAYVGGGLGFEMPYLWVRNSGDERLLYVVSFAAVVITLNVVVFYVVYKLKHSRCGLCILASKNNELATELSGIDVTKMQQVVFAYGTAVAGTAGALFLHFTTMIVPADFSFINGVPIILYVVLGYLGIGRCILSAIVMYGFYELLKLQFFGLFGSRVGAIASEGKEILMAIVLILAVVGPVYASRIGRWKRGRGKLEQA